MDAVLIPLTLDRDSIYGLVALLIKREVEVNDRVRTNPFRRVRVRRALDGAQDDVPTFVKALFWLLVGLVAAGLLAFVKGG